MRCCLYRYGIGHDEIDPRAYPSCTGCRSHHHLWRGECRGADFTKEAFSSLGFEAAFESVDIKPGKPTTFGRIKDTLILNLPGNPLAAALCFEMFGQSAILSLSGRSDKYIAPITTTMGEPFKMKKGRRSLIPGWVNGASFTPSEKFGPGMVLPLSRANAFMMVDASVEGFEKGSSVKIIPTRWCMSSVDQNSLITV